MTLEEVRGGVRARAAVVGRNATDGASLVWPARWDGEKGPPER